MVFAAPANTVATTATTWPPRRAAAVRKAPLPPIGKRGRPPTRPQPAPLPSATSTPALAPLPPGLPATLAPSWPQFSPSTGLLMAGPFTPVTGRATVTPPHGFGHTLPSNHHSPLAHWPKAGFEPSHS